MTWETSEGKQGGITMQVTDVNKPLGSVGKIANAGNRVVFEPDGGYVENIKTKEKNCSSQRRNGVQVGHMGEGKEQ